MPTSLVKSAAMALPLLHEMEERAGERRRSVLAPAPVLLNEMTLSPALSHSFVVGEGEKSGQRLDASPDNAFR
jgi:hypothetical protein